MDPNTAWQREAPAAPAGAVERVPRGAATPGALARTYHGSVRVVHWTDLALALLVAGTGVLAAALTQAFDEAIQWLYRFDFGTLPAFLSARGWPGWLPYVGVPALMGVVVAALKALVPAENKGHAIPEVIVALLRREGRIPLRSTVLKTLAAVVTLGSGGSLGREGPVVLLGGGAGSAVGQALRLPGEWVKVLVAAGAGAAIATAFHAPITGAFFALEIILTQFTARAFALVALASVTAGAVARFIMAAPPFPIPAYRLHSAGEVVAYVGLGLLVAPLALLYIRALHGAEERVARVRRVPAWAKAALGGVLFGLIGLAVPGTLGPGYEVIVAALAGGLPLATLLVLLAGKLATCSITLGSGWSGGVFAPAMYLGAMAGGAYGTVLGMLLPGRVGPPGAYAVVGMAAMIAGATQAPLTGMTLILEVTRDYQIALPAMLACGIASVFSHRLTPYSIDTLHLPEKGVVLPWQVQDLRGIPVREAMVTPVHTVRDDQVLGDVIQLMQRYHHDGYPVLDRQGRLVGIITLGDIRDVPLEGRLRVPVGQVMHRDLEVVTPDQSLADAALALARRGVGRLPVVDPDDPRRLLGIITRSDILRAYQGRIGQGGGLFGV
ncbi:chloride channel protein [Caldinitratiruptor microaerophilus]|uniref:Cl- channel voltage-gated family protein n=1 Tax=Caldinitratiruptor microaerophilus TaxID=671077 RepID=A0AA35CIL6_9FIRM|nr:chloride channel protein [Caldinitratiruptor microaerophilus]BDG59864.1 Cl- channel voltage-gated family protein [Caldinitratiruptor microaerophilus]